MSLVRSTLRALTLGLLLASTAQAAEVGGLIAVSNNKSNGLNGGLPNSGTLVGLDLGTGEGVWQGEHAKAGFSMAYNPVTDQAYAVNGLGGGRQILVTVDPDTLQNTGTVGRLVDASDPTFNHLIAAMGFDDNGRLYGISVRKELIGGFKVPVGTLVSINPATGSATDIGSLGMPVYSRGGTVVDDKFRLLTNTSKDDREFRLYEVRLDNAEPKHKKDLGIIGKAAAVAHDGDGNMFAVMDGNPNGGFDAQGGIPTRSHLYKLKTDGDLTYLGDTGYELLSGMTWMVRPTQCGALTGAKIELKDDAIIDSYTCDGGSTGDDDAQLCANDEIKVQNDSLLDGSASSADKVTVSGNGVITGVINGNSGAFEMPIIDIEAFKDNNDNDLIGLASDGSDPINGDEFLLEEGQTLTLTSGTYWFKKFKVRDNAVLTISGDVVIYAKDEFKTEQFGTFNAAGEAGDVTVFIEGKAEIKHDSIAVATIVAPKADLKVKEQADFSGYLLGKELIVEDTAQVHLDECLMNSAW